MSGRKLGRSGEWMGRGLIVEMGFWREGGVGIGLNHGLLSSHVVV